MSASLALWDHTTPCLWDLADPTPAPERLKGRNVEGRYKTSAEPCLALYRLSIGFSRLQYLEIVPIILRATYVQRNWHRNQWFLQICWRSLSFFRAKASGLSNACRPSARGCGDDIAYGRELSLRLGFAPIGVGPRRLVRHLGDHRVHCGPDQKAHSAMRSRGRLDSTCMCGGTARSSLL